MKKIVFCLVIFGLVACNNSEKKDNDMTEIVEDVVWNNDYQAISLLGDTLNSTTSNEEMVTKFKARKAAFEDDASLSNTIWYGRFKAYTGDYRGAIQIYTEALKTFQNNSRLLRHRGHRFISVREFDKAISDLSKARELIKGKENMMEEDGLPNAQNIPVSTMHGNIYYHLGLAHYLNGNMPEALKAYEMCLKTSPSPDNVVSASHWLYMINRRMNNEDAANKVVQGISSDMNVIENMSYHQACLFYKGELKLEDVYDPSAEGTPTNSALKYAIGNWYYYNNDLENAKKIYEEIISGKDWASFGYIAAEADLARIRF